MRRVRPLLVVIFVWAGAPAAAFAQAAIAGSVKDSSGAPLPGVFVEASSPALIETASKTCDRVSIPSDSRSRAGVPPSGKASS
jgi:hypothetical protein